MNSPLYTGNGYQNFTVQCNLILDYKLLNSEFKRSEKKFNNYY